jgi:nitrate reductase delta subunit
MNMLARLLEYPRPGFQELLDACPAFAAAVHGESLESLQELYTRTFDLNPECSLEIGWHLFGEEYERGSFLVNMRQELRRYGIPESTELPDHLTHVLRLTARMEAEDARVFSSRFILPALQKMLGAMEGKSNPYQKVLEAVRAALAQGVARCPALT